MTPNKEYAKLSDISMRNRQLDHLGLISMYYEKLGLKDLFDSLLPKNREHKISHGTAILAFLLNGLSFSRRQMYLFPEFFRRLPIQRLLGDNIEPEHLNDSVMGELLDKIYAVGPTELFARVVSHILTHEQLDLKRLHADTTNFSVHGDYNADNREHSRGEPTFEITFGHPKDGRWDLKRFVLSLLVNAEGIPLFMKTHSGNSSDHQTIINAMSNVRTTIAESVGDDECIFIADAAFYSEVNIQNMAGQWVTRVPATLKDARTLLQASVNLIKDKEDERYAFHEVLSQYGCVQQKWVLVHSSEMESKMIRTFEKNLEKQKISGEKSFVHLTNKEFACDSDAIKYANEWIKKFPLLSLIEIETTHEYRRATGKKGRPKNGEELNQVSFINGKLIANAEAVSLERQLLGRFILSSNVTDLSGKEILNIYKDQMHVERGFRFLKNKSFLVSEVYLKKPERIEAFAFIMVLCLLIYSLLEYRLREGLKKQGKTIPNSLNKETNRPTLQWAFSFFTIISEVSLFVGGVYKSKSVSQPDDMQTVLTILTALDLPYEKCYSWDSTCRM
jgi:transposase